MIKIKKNAVYKVLLTPIKCTSHSGFGDENKVTVEPKEGVITTTQTYYPLYTDRDTGKPFRYSLNLDCDMSDFACQYYNTIYAHILQDKVVDHDTGNLVNKEFAGDTMTSVRRLPKLAEKYSCLANFWLLPMVLGRKMDNKWCKCSKYTSTDDMMDNFLELLRANFCTYRKMYPEYFKKINNFNEFADVNFLVGSYVDENYNIIKFSNTKNIDAEAVYAMMKNRAKAISASKYCNELYILFEKYGLLY